MTVLRVQCMHPDRVRKLAESFGLSWRSVRRAKDVLGVRSIRAGFPSEVVVWVLPEKVDEMARARAWVELSHWKVTK